MTTFAKSSSGPNGQTLLRLSGLAAIGAGLIFAGIQPVHPADVVASVTTTPWAVILSLKFVMSLLMLVGITGLYLRQLGKIGWLGFAGFAVLVACWFLQSGYIFTELFILPKLALVSPDFVDSLLTMARGGQAALDIGVAAPAYLIAGLLYLLGGIMFGAAIFRANVLPRLAGLLWVATALVTPFAAMLPHAIQRFAAVPMGITMIWLGAALWAERRSVLSAATAVVSGFREKAAN